MAGRAGRKARSTQRIANYYPDWSDIHFDEQSDGFQFLNAIGAQFDDLFKEVQDCLPGLHLATTPVNRLDGISKIRLPESFEFTKIDEDDTEENYYPPVVSGELNNEFYEVALALDNELYNFIKDVPSRITLEESIEDFPYLIFSGYVSESPLVPLVTSGLFTRPSRLYVTESGGGAYLYIDDSNNLHRGLTQIQGTSRYGFDVTEELVFVHDEKQPTLNEFDVVSGLRVYGVSNPEETFVRVQSMDFRCGPYRSTYYLDYSKSDEDIPSFWDIGSGENVGQSTLDFVLYQHPEIDVRVAGFPGTYVAYSQELKDLYSQPVDIVDLAVNNYTDHVWAVSHTRLFCYSTELPYMELQQLKGRSAERACRIETDEDFVLEDGTLRVDFIWRNPTKGIVANRVTAEHQTGTKYVLDGDTLIAFDSADEYWNYGEPISRFVRQSIDLSFPTTGRFVLILEVKFADGTIEKDKRVIFSGPQLTPFAEFPLDEIGIHSPAIGIHIDDEDYIWILDVTGAVHKIARHYDTMLIDYKEKTIYLREDYDRVIVDPDNYSDV